MEFKLPSLGENIESGDVVKVLVQVGDQIKKQQPILELETDKAVIEVPSSMVGTVEEIHIKEGEKAQVGQVILTVGGAARKKEVKKSKAKPEVAKKPKAKEPERPRQVKAQKTAPVLKQAAKDRVVAASQRETARTEVVDFTPTRSETAPKVVAKPVPAAPSVRRFARQIGVDIHQVEGSGPTGRISVEDVKTHARTISEEKGDLPAEAGVVAAPLSDFSQWGRVERQPFSNVRRKTAEHVSASWRTVPHVTQYDKADISQLELARKRYAKRVDQAGGKLTITAIVLKVAASALKVFPQFNASINLENKEIIYKKYCHIGVAVDTDRGLLVPVIRDVDQKNILSLSVELAAMAEKAREAKLTVQEMQGGCFTITNLGGIGGTYFSPIINVPEVAILGISRGNVEPVYEDGEFKPRLMLPLSLSYDHRLIDGANAIRFLRWVAEALEDPFLVSLEG